MRRCTIAAMTTSTSPHDPLEAWRRPLSITDPADLIVAVPALLGFHPQRSLVLICLGGRSSTSVGAVMRHDLVSDAGMGAVVEQFGIICANERATAAMALVVDDRGGEDESYDTLLDVLAQRLGDSGAELVGAHRTRRIAKGERWWGLLGDPRWGVLPDPTASSVAAAHVLEGKQIRASRTDLTALLDGDVRERIAVADCVDDLREHELLARLSELAEPAATELSRLRLDLVLWQIATVASGERLQPVEFAEIVMALDDRSVRDALVALAIGPDAVAAEMLWLALTQVAPVPYRADAAALLGFFAYIRSDGPLAGIALSVALDSNPAHGLAALLDTALTSGLRPSKMWPVAESGYDVADRLGVNLPPPD